MTTDDLVQRMVERAERAICWEDELEYRKANRGFSLCGCVAGKCSGTLRRLSGNEARAALLAALEEMREPSEEMIDAGCDCDAYEIAVLANKTRHEQLMAKYPALVKPRETHGAAAVQTLPIVWDAMLSHLIERLKA